VIPSRELVIQKVEALFPAERRDAVLDALDRYAGDAPEGRARVQLAILKASNGDHEQLREWVDVAQRDFRDVLAAAEYPGQMALGFTGMSALPATERDRIVRQDREQWLAWLAS
jgi:hypothetical protein